MKTETWVRLSAIGICTVIATIAGYVIIRYFAGILLPFVLAALVASMLRPATELLRQKFRLPEKLGGTVLILGAVSLLSLGIAAIGQFLYDGAREVIAALPAMLKDADNPLRRLIDLIERVSASAGGEAGNFEALYGMLSGMIEQAVSTASTMLTSGATAAIMGLPRVILSLVVAIIALFYLLFSRETLSDQLRQFFGDKTLSRLTAFFVRLRTAVGKCMRAYLTLLLLTYAELLSGFLILNVRRPAAVAAIVALIDLLPVFGVGTVLVPWSIFAIFGGDVYRGVGLLILFGIMYIVRQFVEPRILGSTIGVHPLFTLIAVFTGFSLFGIGGMLLAPLLLYTAKAAITEISAGEDNTALSDAAPTRKKG